MIKAEDKHLPGHHSLENSPYFWRSGFPSVNVNYVWVMSKYYVNALDKISRNSFNLDIALHIQISMKHISFLFIGLLFQTSERIESHQNN